MCQLGKLRDVWRQDSEFIAAEIKRDPIGEQKQLRRQRGKGVEKYPSIKQFQLSVMLNKHFFSFVSVTAA
jgi:hypothetical protein